MRIALVSCRNARHNCAGAADCLRMFHHRAGEFQIYAPEDEIAAVVPCDYCICGSESYDKHMLSWTNEKNHITHVHLAACTSLCPAGNYEAIKQYFLDHGMTIGEFHEEK